MLKGPLGDKRLQVTLSAKKEFVAGVAAGWTSAQIPHETGVRWFTKQSIGSLIHSGKTVIDRLLVARGRITDSGELSRTRSPERGHTSFDVIPPLYDHHPRNSPLILKIELPLPRRFPFRTGCFVSPIDYSTTFIGLTIK